MGNTDRQMGAMTAVQRTAVMGRQRVSVTDTQVSTHLYWKVAFSVCSSDRQTKTNSSMWQPRQWAASIGEG